VIVDGDGDVNVAEFDSGCFRGNRLEQSRGGHVHVAVADNVNERM
jgi:hypothetical protein